MKLSRFFRHFLTLGNMDVITMKTASARTGLSPHVIRVWEQRYKAVVPARTETNRRVYSEEQVERLRLLGMATRAGHSIRLI